MFSKTANKIVPFIPLTYYWIIRRKLDKNVYSVLDVGCGKGQPMKLLSSSKRFYRVGADLFKPFIIKAKHEKIHDEYVLCDVRFLPFKPRSFDLVLCLHIIEHLQKSDGLRLIEQIERISRVQIIVVTPVGFIPFLPLDGDYNENPLQEHRSGWIQTEFIERGYEVRGQGLRAIYGEYGLAHKFSKHIRYLTYIVSYLLEPITYFFPNLAVYVVCVKKLM
jgi:ubiquinone/menaquinone biosynthesis C-methylase UbiE